MNNLIVRFFLRMFIISAVYTLLRQPWLVPDLSQETAVFITICIYILLLLVEPPRETPKPKPVLVRLKICSYPQKPLNEAVEGDYARCVDTGKMYVRRDNLWWEIKL